MYFILAEMGFLPVGQADLKLLALSDFAQLGLPKCWDCRCEPLRPAYFKVKRRKTIYLSRYLPFLLLLLQCSCSKFPSGIISLPSEELLIVLLEWYSGDKILVFTFVQKCLYFVVIPEGYFCWI